MTKNKDKTWGKIIKKSAEYSNLSQWIQEQVWDYMLLPKHKRDGVRLAGKIIKKVETDAVRGKSKEIDKLAKFFMKEMPEEIKEGSAVDNAIRLLRFDKWYKETKQPKLKSNLKEKE